MTMTASDSGVRIHHATDREGHAILDRAARRYLHMGGEEFVAAWNAGRFDDDADRPEVMRVAMLLPFVR